MPLHDWTPVPAGLYQLFHQDWSIELARTLNRGILSAGLSAVVEQRAGPRESDVLAVELLDLTGGTNRPETGREGAVVTMTPPTTHIVRRTRKDIYASRANRVVIRHHLGRVVAVIEILSPGNKDSRSALRDFVENTIEFLQAGVHVLIVDLFPPTTRDPYGIHKAVWDEIEEEDFTFPPGKDRILVSYETGIDRAAYIEPVGVGDELPHMPLFLTRAAYVLVPLEPTYQAAWEARPQELRTAAATGLLPDVDAD